MLTENESAGIAKDDFLKKYIGPEKFAKIDAAIAKWAEEKGIPMYVFGFRHPSLVPISMNQFFQWHNEPIHSGT